jgi:transcriptional regulator with XRE-family HTH domain
MKYSRQKLDALIEEAIADCHDDEEAVMGFHAVIEENLELPFTTGILGIPVTITNIALNNADELVAVCERKGRDSRAGGVTLTAVARRAGISEAMLSRIEPGERASPQFTTIAKIAYVLGVSLDEIAHAAGIATAVHRRTPATAAIEIRQSEKLHKLTAHLVDLANRQSFATYVMEPVRPHVDAFVLNLIRTRTFAVKDFFEKRDGGCRISAALTRELATTMPEWAKHVAPFAEMAWRHVSKATTKDLQLLLPSAQQKNIRKDAKPSATAPTVAVEVPKGKAPEAKKTVPLAQVYNACRHCGGAVTVRRRIYCDPCYAEWRRSGNFTFLNRTAVKEEIALCKAVDDSPNFPEARQKCVRSASVHWIAVTSWKEDGSLDGIDFVRGILPTLRGHMVKEISEAMGVAVTYASQVRARKVVPHRRLWKLLMSL